MCRLPRKAISGGSLHVDSSQPVPLLVCIHGGGFRAGDKDMDFALRPLCLEMGIAVACINYRFSQHAIYPASMQDGARAVQFLRFHANEWNLDPGRFAACGNSAGAGISLWLGFRPDMADRCSTDPISRGSTRLSCMISYSGQCSYDPRFVKKHIRGPAYRCSALLDLFGITLDQLDDPPPDKARLMEDASPINFIGPETPPAYMIYNEYNLPTTPHNSEGEGIHHPTYGVELKKKMDVFSRECYVRAYNNDPADFPTEMEFLSKHLGLSV
jgi:acetyl esterase/lipase